MNIRSAAPAVHPVELVAFVSTIVVGWKSAGIGETASLTRAEMLPVAVLLGFVISRQLGRSGEARSARDLFIGLCAVGDVTLGSITVEASDLVIAVIAASMLKPGSWTMKRDRLILTVAGLYAAYFLIGIAGMGQHRPKLLLVGIAMTLVLVRVSAGTSSQRSLSEELFPYAAAAAVAVLGRGLLAHVVLNDTDRVTLKLLWVAYAVLLASAESARGRLRVIALLLAFAALTSSMAFDASRQSVVAIGVVSILAVGRSMVRTTLATKLSSTLLSVGCLLAVSVSGIAGQVLLRVGGGGSAAQSDDQRMVLLQESLGLWRDYPAFGGGAGSFLVLAERLQLTDPNGAQLLSPHSFALLILAETGVVGVVLWLVLAGVVSVRVTRVWRVEPLAAPLWGLAAFGIVFSDLLGSERVLLLLAIVALRHKSTLDDSLAGKGCF